MNIAKHKLEYDNLLSARSLTDIELLVIHCTELPDMSTARDYAEKILYDSGTGNSGHFYISRSGEVQQWVSLKRIAHHVQGHNQHSIGIELINKGRFPHWHHSKHQLTDEPYPERQIDALVRLIQYLSRQLPNLKHIVGHEDLDQRRVVASDNSSVKVPRKIDPGPLFPWTRVMQQTHLINIGTHAQNYDKTTK